LAVQSGALTPPLKAKGGGQRALLGKRKPSGYLYILPAVVLLGLFIVYPFIRAGQYSFLSWDGVGPSHWVGGFNWEQIYLDPVERGSLVNAATLFIFFSLVPVALAVVWTWILAPGGTGSLNGVIHALGLGPAIGPAWLGDFSTALLAIGLVGTWTEFGLCFVLFLAGIQRIPTEMFDSARIDGAGLIREFRSVIVPMLRREIGAAITISVVASLQSFPLIYQATNGGPGTATTTPGLLVYRDAFQLGDVGGASALGIALAIVTFILTFGVRALLERNAV